MFLMKSYLMLQNARFKAFTVSELLRENQQWGVKISSTHNKVRVNNQAVHEINKEHGLFWRLEPIKTIPKVKRVLLRKSSAYF